MQYIQYIHMSVSLGSATLNPDAIVSIERIKRREILSVL